MSAPRSLLRTVSGMDDLRHELLTFTRARQLLGLTPAEASDALYGAGGPPRYVVAGKDRWLREDLLDWVRTHRATTVVIAGAARARGPQRRSAA